MLADDLPEPGDPRHDLAADRLRSRDRLVDAGQQRARPLEQRLTGERQLNLPG